MNSRKSISFVIVLTLLGAPKGSFAGIEFDTVKISTMVETAEASFAAYFAKKASIAQNVTPEDLNSCVSTFKNDMMNALPPGLTPTKVRFQELEKISYMITASPNEELRRQFVENLQNFKFSGVSYKIIKNLSELFGPFLRHVSEDQQHIFTPKVAVLDSGFYHPDLERFLDKKNGWCSSDGDTFDVSPRGNEKKDHGTHVAGIVVQASYADKQKDPEIIVPMRIDHYTSGTLVSALEKIQTLQDVSIVNLSLGMDGVDFDDACVEAMRQTAKAGKLIFLAAGNNNEIWGTESSNKNFTHLLEEAKGRIVLVGSHAWGGRLFQGSGQWRGPASKYFITAPGHRVRSWVPPTEENPKGFQIKTGTSMAAPEVAGLAQFLKYTYPEFSVDDISKIILSSAIPQENSEYGVGILSPRNALKMAKEKAKTC